MKLFFSFILLINIFNAHAGGALNINDLIKNSGFLDFLFEKDGCPEIFKHLPEQSAETLFAKGYALRSKHKDCDSLQYFQEVRRQWPIQPHFKKAWMEVIKSYILADDYLGAINEGNDFIHIFAGNPEAEEINFVLINAVNSMMVKAGTERSQEWTEYALGISQKQNDDNPYLKNLSFKAFLEKYPNSPNKETIESMMRLARDNHAEYHLKVGNYYSTRKTSATGIPNYPAAILRYDIVLKWGPVVSSFSQAMYATVTVLYKMKEVILSPDVLSEEKLKEWLQIDSLRDKKLIDRKAIADQIDLQIKELKKKASSATITQDIWIQKTKALVEEKQK